MSDEYQTIGEVLGDLAGHGVYDVAIIHDQLGKYGFTYSAGTDLLHYADRSERLGAMGKEQIEEQMASDPRGGVLDKSAVPGQLLVDALALSAAIYKLLMPGQNPPSGMYYGRGKGFARNVEAIVAFEAIQAQGEPQ